MLKHAGILKANLSKYYLAYKSKYWVSWGLKYTLKQTVTLKATEVG